MIASVPLRKTPLQKTISTHMLTATLLAVVAMSPCLLSAQEAPPADTGGGQAMPAEVEAGIALFAEEKYEEALVQFQAALASDAVKAAPAMQPLILARASECYLELERFAEAVQMLTGSIDFMTANQEAYGGIEAIRPLIQQSSILRGKAYVGLKDYNLALNDFNLVASSAAQVNLELTARLERGKLHMEMRNFTSALLDFEQGTSLAPTNAEFLYNRGSALLKFAGQLSFEGNSEEAQAKQAEALMMIERAIEQNPNYVEAIYDRGQIRAQSGQIEEGIADLEQAVQLDSTNSEYVRQLGTAYIQQGRIAAAEDSQTPDPQKRAEANEKFNQGLQKLDLALSLLQAKPEEERTDEDEGERLSIWTSQAELYISMARLLSESGRAGQYATAIATCEKVLAEESPLAKANFWSTALYWQGVAERLSDKNEAAIETFTKLIDTSPQIAPTARLRRGIVMFHQGDLELALEDFNDVGYMPTDPRPMFWAGLTHARMGDFSKAIISYSLAIRNDPGFTLAYANRGLAYLQEGEYERAVHDFNQPLRFDHRDATSYYRRGFALEQLGQTERARFSYQRALVWNPKLSAASEGLRRVSTTQ